MLDGIHPDLIAVLKKAATLTRTRFSVFRGRMTEDEHRTAIEEGTVRPANKRHVTGHAVNIMPNDGEGNPLPYGTCFTNVADAILLAAHDLAIPVDWGGWRMVDPDQSQFELRWDVYPPDWDKGPFRA